METILLKSKNPCRNVDLVVFDELITGVLSSDYFLPVFTGANNGMHVIPLSFLAENYLWPKKDEEVLCRCYYFLTGNRPHVAKQIEFYNDDTIEV